MKRWMIWECKSTSIQTRASHSVTARIVLAVGLSPLKWLALSRKPAQKKNQAGTCTCPCSCCHHCRSRAKLGPALSLSSNSFLLSSLLFQTPPSWRDDSVKGSDSDTTSLTGTILLPLFFRLCPAPTLKPNRQTRAWPTHQPSLHLTSPSPSSPSLASSLLPLTWAAFSSFCCRATCSIDDPRRFVTLANPLRYAATGGVAESRQRVWAVFQTGPFEGLVYASGMECVRRYTVKMCSLV